MPEEGSLVVHLGSNLEANSISQRLLRILFTLLIEPPSLVETIVASPPGSVHVIVVVSSSPDIKAHVGSVSDVPS
jgi:hypothetical protein